MRKVFGCLVLLLIHQPASAELVRIDFEGKIDLVANRSWRRNIFSLKSQVKGYFVYNSSAKDLSPDAEYGTFGHAATSMGLTVFNGEETVFSVYKNGGFAETDMYTNFIGGEVPTYFFFCNVAKGTTSTLETDGSMRVRFNDSLGQSGRTSGKGLPTSKELESWLSEGTGGYSELSTGHGFSFYMESISVSSMPSSPMGKPLDLSISTKQPGKMEIGFIANIGEIYQVYHSSDLRKWELADTIKATTVNGQYTASMDGQEEQYYRIIHSKAAQ